VPGHHSRGGKATQLEYVYPLSIDPVRRHARVQVWQNSDSAEDVRSARVAGKQERRKQLTARRGRGDGAIYQRSSDLLWVGYAILPESGKRKYVYSKTRKEVAAKLKLLQKEIDNRTVVTSRPETVEAFLSYWLGIRRGQKNIKISTHNNYENHLKPMYPYIGKIKLAKLTTGTFQQMFNALLETRKASTVHSMHTILSTAFYDAIKWQRLSFNPCKHVELPHAEQHEGPVLTGEQALHLMDTAKGHALECFVTIALATGMRRGELLGLKWADIDMEQKTLRVTCTLAQVHDETGTYRTIETTPKSKAGKRTIRLAQFAMNVLKEHRMRQLEQRLQTGVTWQDADLIFCKANGEHLALTTLERHFRKLLKLADLPEMRIHDLRHSAATLLLKMGVSLKVIQEILGHSNFSTTANLYAHVLMELQDSAMDKMDSLFLLAK
jgi:integrase